MMARAAMPAQEVIMAGRMVLAALVVMTGACGAGPFPSPTSPSPAAAPRQVIAEGMPLVWKAAPGCNPEWPFPAVAGTEPGRTLLLSPGELRAFWATEAAREVAPNVYHQKFVVGDFSANAERGAWLLCRWEEQLRERVVCDDDVCP